MWWLSLILVLTASLAAAQTRVSPDTFLEFAKNRTLFFRNFPEGGLVGREYFVGKYRSVWQRADGSCTYGTITTPNGQLCFSYEDDFGESPHCWFVFTMDDRFIVRDTDQIVGAEMQEVFSVKDEPLACVGIPTS